MLKDMTASEIKDLMHKRIRAVWRRAPQEMVFRDGGDAILDGLWEYAKDELRRREADERNRKEAC